MYRSLLLIITLLTFYSAQASDLRDDCHRSILHSAQADDSVSIQTLNTYQTSYSRESKKRRLSVLKFLRQDNSDIIFFQEVWSEYFHENIEEASQSIGLKSINYDALAKNTKSSGLVTIVRGDIHEKEIHFFPYGRDIYENLLYRPSNTNKGFGIAYVTHPKFPDTPFWTVNIHLHHYKQKTRLLQLVHYLKWFLNKTILQSPIIFAGDFNFKPDSLEFKMIQYMFRFKEPQSCLGLDYKSTYCKDNPYTAILGYIPTTSGKTVDYIFFRSSPKVKLNPKKFRIFPKRYEGRFLSDHYGLKTDITFKNAQGLQQPINEKELKERIQKFSQTFDKVKSLLNKGFVSEHQFLNSIRQQLQEPDSLLLHHLKQN